MGRRKGALYLAIAACVVVAGGLVVGLRGSSSPVISSPATSAPVVSPPVMSSQATSSPAAPSPGATTTTAPTSSPIATAQPAPTATIESVTWQPGAVLSLEGDGTGMAVIPMGDRLIAVGAVGYAPSLGNLGSAAVWSSTDAMAWKMISKPGAFSEDSAYVRSATPDGRGGIYVIASRYDIARPDALWHSPDGATWTRLTVGSSQVLTNATLSVSNGVAVVTGQALEQARPKRYVWRSSDAINWTQATLPGAYPDVDGRALITGGVRGFEIVETSGAGSAWHSDDGQTWVKSNFPGAGTFPNFTPTQLLASDTTYLAMGFDRVDGVDGDDGGSGGAPLAWTSVDGVSWSRSTIEDPSPAFGCEPGCQPAAITKVGSALVAVGYRSVQVSETWPVSTPIVTWVSADDGRTWHVRGFGSSGVLPSALVPFGSDVLMFGQLLPETNSPYDLGFWRVARGTITWQSARP
jgi:hypothetical protein